MGFAAITSRSYSFKEVMSEAWSIGIPALVYSTLQKGLNSCKQGLKFPLKLMSKNMDKRTMRDLVNEAGFEHMQFDC